MTNLKNTKSKRKVHIMIIMDGASDHFRLNGKSPLEIAETPHLDKITERSGIGRLQTLYSDLPKDSVVAQLGLLGYDPYKYFPLGRSYFEVPDDIEVNANDLIFRVNLVHFDDDHVLTSYSGNSIDTTSAKSIIKYINESTDKVFPEFRLYNNSDFRNSLIIKNVGRLDFELKYWEPHEEQGRNFADQNLITASVKHPFVDRINEYVNFVSQKLKGREINGIFPWGYSHSIDLPKFSENLKGCIIGNMDFLNGFSRKMGLDFYKIGNSNWDTDYAGKGKLLVEQFEKGDYDFIYCHINGPDEASHLNDLEKKIFSIEQIDKHILGPVFHLFRNETDELGSVMISPDHYTNINLLDYKDKRRDAHSVDPVPFVIWNDRIKDEVLTFSEKNAMNGCYKEIINHCDLMDLMGIKILRADKKHNISSNTNISK